MIREPEMVKAYRDTWALGLHSYLAYLRCKIASTLRARATFVRFIPRRLATSIPHRFSAEKRVTRDSITLAALPRSDPRRSVVPLLILAEDLYFARLVFLRGQPEERAAALDFPIRGGSSASVLNVIATRAPP